MNRSFALHFVLAGALFLSAGRAFGSPVPQQYRIPQTIIVNGQQAEGVTVIQNGLAQAFNCPNPRPYTAADQSTSGWACFDANTGSWLLNAMLPACVYAERPHRHVAPYDVYIYAYPDYTYYPEVFFDRPPLSIGFGFGHGQDCYVHEHGAGRTGHCHGGHDGGCHR